MTGGGAGAAWPSGTNKLNILEYKADCSAPADLGECAVSYKIAADDKSTAHFSAIDEKSQDIYVCEVSTNKFHKFTYKSAK